MDLDTLDSSYEPFYMLAGQNVVDFAAKSVLALSLLPSSFNELGSLRLPLISPNKLNTRFKIDQNKTIFVVITKSYFLLKNQLVQLNYLVHRGIYLTGPVGVGKSYLLYLLAAEHRMNRKEYRVTYINDCGAWRRLPWEYLGKELLASFYDDVIQDKSMLYWYEAILKSERNDDLKYQMLKDLVLRLASFIAVENLKWIIIFDQHNALYNPDVVKLRPFDLIQTLADVGGELIKIVVSASANNEGYPTELQGWKTYKILFNRFDDKEFSEWCDKRLFEDGSKVDPKSDEALEALFWTGGIPFELDYLWEQTAITLTEKIQLYCQQRNQDMRYSHKKFRKQLDKDDMANLNHCISYMALGLPRPKGIEGMDRQLLDIVRNDQGQELIVALNPVARLALLEYHGMGLSSSLEIVTKEILNNIQYTNDIKGRILELYILTVLEIRQSFSFRYKITPINRFRKMKSKTLDMQRVIHFPGNKLPLHSLFNPKITTLFIPESPTYPGLDFFIWNAKDQVLMGFQITVINPFTSHRKVNTTGEIYNQWLIFCNTQKPIEIYWIIPEKCLGKSKNFNVILLKDLTIQFPAVSQLELA